MYSIEYDAPSKIYFDICIVMRHKIYMIKRIINIKLSLSAFNINMLSSFGRMLSILTWLSLSSLICFDRWHNSNNCNKFAKSQ